MTKQKRHGIKRKLRDSLHEEHQNEVIQRWRDERLKKMNSRKPYGSFYVHSFSLKTLQSFAQNFNFMVLLQMAWAGLAVYVFQAYDIWFDFHVTLFVSPIVFPLAFSINTDFQRREKVLEDLAQFKSSGMIWYFCMRDWKHAAQLDNEWFSIVHAKRRSVLFHIREFLLTYKQDRRKIILRAIYEDFSDMNQLIEKLRSSKLPTNTAIISRAIHLLNMMCLSFERLRVIREYRSPRSIRSFNKALIMILPVILSPYFVHVGYKSNNKFGPYFLSVLVAFVFSALQGVQDKLDDPFDGVSEDDIQLDTFDEWNNSLEYVLKRKVHSIKTIKDNIEKYYNSFKLSFDEMVSTKRDKPITKTTTNTNRTYNLHAHNSSPQLRPAGSSLSSLEPSENYVSGHMVHGISGLAYDSSYTIPKSANNKLYKSLSRDNDNTINKLKRQWSEHKKSTAGYGFKSSITESHDETKDKSSNKSQATILKTNKELFPIDSNIKTKDVSQNGGSTEISEVESDVIFESDVICTNDNTKPSIRNLTRPGEENDVDNKNRHTYYEPETENENETIRKTEENILHTSGLITEKFSSDRNGTGTTVHSYSSTDHPSTAGIRTNNISKLPSISTKNDVITLKTDNARPSSEIRIIISSQEKSDESFNDDFSGTTNSKRKSNNFFSETIIVDDKDGGSREIITKKDGVLVANQPSRYLETHKDLEQRKVPGSSWNILNKSIKRKFFANGRNVNKDLF